MSPAGYRPGRAPCNAGFTLFELLVVMLVMAITVAAVSTLYRSPSGGLQVKATAQLAASRLRDLRAAALASGRERVATIDVDARRIGFADGKAPLAIDPSISLAVTSAESERRSRHAAGIRFFPNGGSSGGTIQLRSQRQAYEIRINWLTGRVSTAPIN